MNRYRATFRQANGRVADVTLLARNRWDAYAALFDAAGDKATDLRLRPPPLQPQAEPAAVRS